ncbi:hypothetical protein, partial [Bradyrhizobium sp.]|uniref:hypothetical protein n=1 Tax=Bradyrhizobium sp. TaxID=376 RepID=UPI003C72032D
MTVVGDCSLDGGTTYLLTGTPSATGVVQFTSELTDVVSVANPGNVSYTLRGCDGATHTRVRAGAFTSGSVAAQLRATFNDPTRVNLYAFNDTTGLSDRLKAGSNATDAGTTASGLLLSNSFAYGFDGSGWRRLRSNIGSADGVAATYGLHTVSETFGYNGTTFDRIRSFAGNADTVTSPTLGLLGTGSFLLGYNGTNWDRLRATTANGLAVDVTRVQGTIASTQSGTWTVQPGNTANTTAWLVTGTGGTFPITAASLPLPTGAATEASLAKLTITQGAALGANTVVLDGGSVTTAAPTYTTGQISPLSLQTDGSLRVAVTAGGGSNASVGATGSAPPSSATLAGGSVTTAAPTYTTGQMSALSLDTTGSLRVINTGAGGGGTSSNFAAAFPAAGTAVGFSDGTNMVAGRAGVTNADAVVALAAGAVVTQSNTMMYNGTTWDRVRGTTTNGLLVDVTRVQGTNTNTTGAISTACAGGTSCAGTALVTAALLGKTGAGAQVTAISAPTGITVQCDVSTNGGTTWSETAAGNCFFKNAKTLIKGATITAFAVGDTYTLMLPFGVTNVRVRASALTSGTVTFSVSATDSSDTSEFFSTPGGATSWPPGMAALAAQDGVTATTSNPVRSAATNTAAAAAPMLLTIPAIARSAVQAATAGNVAA